MASGRARASREAAIISSRLRSARTTSEYFQLRTSPCSVMRSSPVKLSRGWAKMARWVGPPPRPTVPPRPWKRRRVDAALAGDFMEGAVGLPDLPGAGDHAAIFVGVGVAEHDFLLVIPGREQRLVDVGGPELAADGGRVLQVFDGLEEGDGLQAGVGVGGIVGAFDADAAEAGEPEDVEDIFGGGGAADDVAGERFGWEVAFELRDGAEGGEDLGGLGGERGRELEVGGVVRGAGGLRELGDGGGVDAGVLADVERLQVEAVGADFEQERVDVGCGRGGGPCCGGARSE